MALIDDITLGRFVPGDSLLHRLDPRIKLFGLPLLVIAAFAAPAAGQRLALALLAAGLILLGGGHWRFFGRGLWLLRWLFLFTLLLHLLLSPGRTLLGSAWLSLDGLLRGLQVCEQLALAVLFSSLLTLTTSPPQLAAAVAAVLRPLGRLGFPARESAMLLLLVLHFIPLLREEALAELGAGGAAAADARRPGLLARGRVLARGRAVGRMLAPLLLRLVERADRLAHAAASGEEVIAEPPPLPPLRRAGPLDAAALFLFPLLLTLLFTVLR